MKLCISRVTWSQAHISCHDFITLITLHNQRIWRRKRGRQQNAGSRSADPLVAIYKINGKIKHEKAQNYQWDLFKFTNMLSSCNWNFQDGAYGGQVVDFHFLRLWLQVHVLFMENWARIIFKYGISTHWKIMQ